MAKVATIGSKPQTNFGGILDAAPTEVERPKAYPVGSYLTVINGMPRYDKSSKKQTEFVEFTHNFLQAGEDVDADELEEVLKGEKLNSKSIKNTYYLTETSIYRLDEFHEHCGIELDAEVSRRQRNEQCVGRQVWITIKHEASEDGKSVFARIAGTAPVEE